jgi:hypothetical protein
MKARVLTAALAASLLLAGSAHAQLVFKCTDRQGRITYSDSPCPTNSAKARDITSAVQVCADEECDSRRQREVELARQRLHEDKLALAEMTAQRRKAEAEYQEHVTRLQEIKARQAAAERTALNDPYYDRWGYGWGYGWVVPGYPVARTPLRPPRATPHHAAHRDVPHRSQQGLTRVVR